MSSDKQTFWIIVDVKTLTAIRAKKAKRKALQFKSYQAAESWLKKLGIIAGQYLIVEVPA